MTLKIIVLGAANVGKTSIMKRYVEGTFSPERKASVGTDFMRKTITLNNAEVELQIWDTAGSERFHAGTLGSAFYRNAHGCLLVYDVTSTNSMSQLIKWKEEVLEKVGDASFIPIVVVANKIDMQGDDTPDNSEVVNWCKDHFYGHIEASVKDNIGVAAAMNAITALAIETIRNSQNKRDSSDVSISYNSNGIVKSKVTNTVRLEDKFGSKKKSSCC